MLRASLLATILAAIAVSAASAAAPVVPRRSRQALKRKLPSSFQLDGNKVYRSHTGRYVR